MSKLTVTTSKLDEPLTPLEILLTALIRFAAVIAIIAGFACIPAVAILTPTVSLWYLFLLLYPLFLVCVGWVLDDEEKNHENRR